MYVRTGYSLRISVYQSNHCFCEMLVADTCVDCYLKLHDVILLDGTDLPLRSGLVELVKSDFVLNDYIIKTCVGMYRLVV